jgi:hypothetical protein
MFAADTLHFPAHLVTVLKAMGSREESVEAYLTAVSAPDKQVKLREWWQTFFDDVQGFSY